MRKLTIVLLIMFCSGPLLVSAQDNVAKMDITGFILKRVGFAYERVLNEKLTIGAGMSVQFKRGLPSAAYDYEGEGYSADQIQWKGIKITPELRFYPKGEAPSGFYIAPYTRINSFNIQMEGEFEDNDGVNHDALLDIKTKQFGGGIGLGAQWVIKDHYVIDFTFFGLGFVGSWLKLEVTDRSSTMDATDYQEVVDDAVDEYNTLPIGKVKSTEVGDNFGRATMTMPLPSIRFALSFGGAW